MYTEQGHTNIVPCEPLIHCVVWNAYLCSEIANINLYSGKLLREKRFTNFMVLGLPMKVLSVKFDSHNNISSDAW